MTIPSWKPLTPFNVDLYVDWVFAYATKFGFFPKPGKTDTKSFDTFAEAAKAAKKAKIDTVFIVAGDKTVMVKDANWPRLLKKPPTPETAQAAVDAWREQHAGSRAAPARASGPRPTAEGAPTGKIRPDDPRIVHSIKPNPKKPGSKSFERYAFYREGISVADFLKAGGSIDDVKHDLGKGFIQLRAE